MSAYKRRCAFSECDSAAGDCHLYAFPVHEPAACREWVRRADNPCLDDLPPERLKNRNVCEKHFSPNAFQSKGRRRLRPFVKPIYAADGRLIEDVDESEVRRVYPKSLPRDRADSSEDEQIPLLNLKCKSSLSALKARRMKAIAQSKLRRLAAKKPETGRRKISVESKEVSSRECEPVTAEAMLSKIHSGNTSDVCCLCLCDDGGVSQSTSVYLKDEYTEGSHSLATLARELQLDEILSQNLLQSLCECCAKQLALFYLFKNKCTKLASGLTNLYTLSQSTKDKTNFSLEFEKIQEYAIKSENTDVCGVDEQMEIEVLKTEEQTDSVDRTIGSIKRTLRSNKNDSDKAFDRTDSVKLIDLSQNEAVTIVVNAGNEDPLNCNTNVKMKRSEIARKNELHKFQTVAKCIVRGRKYCSCCLMENQALLEVLETLLFVEARNEIIAIQDLLVGNYCDKNWGLDATFICQECLDVTIRAYNFRSMFENSTILIRNCTTALENCLNNTEKFKHKKNMQIINLYEYFNEYLPAGLTMKTFNPTKAITCSTEKTLNATKPITSKRIISNTRDRRTSTTTKRMNSITSKIKSNKSTTKRLAMALRKTSVSKRRSTKPADVSSTAAEPIDDYAQSDRDFNSDDSNDSVMEPATIEQKIVDPISACHICGEEFTCTDKEREHISTAHTKVSACPHCNKIFSAKASIENHIEKCKSTEKPFGCDLCDAIFVLKKDADEHRVKHFPKTLKCDLCDTMVWTTRQLYLHKRVHKELLEKRTYECSICHSIHASTKVLQKHMATHPPDSTHFCKYCWGTYKSRMTYNAHKCPGKVLKMQKANVSQNDEETNVHNDTDNTETPVEPDSFKSTICDLCGLVVKSPKVLKKHRRRRHGIVDKNEPDKDICKTAMCDICGQFFKNVSTLRVHREYHKNDHEKDKLMQNKNIEVKIVKHHGKTYKRMFVKFACEYCNNYETIYKTCLELHVNKQHLKIKPFKCSICDKCYYTKELLWAHHKGHSDISFQCNECGKKYKGRKALKIHMRSHTGERPYPCDLCDAKFVTACRRQVHKIRKHAEPTLQCKICLKLFYTNVSLRYHVRDCHSGNPKRKH